MLLSTLAFYKVSNVVKPLVTFSRLKAMDEAQKFMHYAISLAEENLETLGGGPFGCVIVRDGEELSAEPNTVKRDCDPTAHAEMNAIRQAAQKIGSTDLSDCILYTSSEPCPMRLSAIYWAGIPEVYYGNTREDAERDGFGDQHIVD